MRARWDVSGISADRCVGTPPSGGRWRSRYALHVLPGQRPDASGRLSHNLLRRMTWKRSRRLCVTGMLGSAVNARCERAALEMLEGSLAWAQGWLEMALRGGGESCAARMALPSMRPYIPSSSTYRALALWRVSSLRCLLPGRGVLQTLPDWQRLEQRCANTLWRTGPVECSSVGGTRRGTLRTTWPRGHQEPPRGIRFFDPAAVTMPFRGGGRPLTRWDDTLFTFSTQGLQQEPWLQAATGYTLAGWRYHRDDHVRHCQA